MPSTSLEIGECMFTIRYWRFISFSLPIGIDNLSLLLLLAIIWARVGQVSGTLLADWSQSCLLTPLWPSHHDTVKTIIFSLCYDWILIALEE
jgi:hypothetical protein